MWTRWDEQDGAGWWVGWAGIGGGLLCLLNVSGDTNAAPGDAGLGSGGALLPDISESAPNVPLDTWEPPDMLFAGIE